VNGGACSNRTRVRREKRFAERTKATQQKGADAPRELAAPDARIARLKERVRTGDPELTDDELQAAIDRAQTKRQELAVSQPESGGEVWGEFKAQPAALFRVTDSGGRGEALRAVPALPVRVRVK
jgi:hypothetical protein